MLHIHLGQKPLPDVDFFYFFMFSQRMMTFSEMLLFISKKAQDGSASIIFNSEIHIYAGESQTT